MDCFPGPAVFSESAAKNLAVHTRRGDEQDCGWCQMVGVGQMRRGWRKAFSPVLQQLQPQAPEPPVVRPLNLPSACNGFCGPVPNFGKSGHFQVSPCPTVTSNQVHLGSQRRQRCTFLATDRDRRNVAAAWIWACPGPGHVFSPCHNLTRTWKGKLSAGRALPPETT